MGPRIGKRSWAVPWRRIATPSGWPIAVRMSLDMLLAALVPLGLAVWLTSVQSSRELEQAARENLQLLAEVTAARLDQLVVDTSRMAQQVARDEAAHAICCGSRLTPELRAAVQRQLDNVLQTNPDYASVFVTNAKGIGLAGTNPRNVGMDLNFREYYRRARAGEVYVSDFTVGRTTGEPGVYFSAPVFAGDSRQSRTVAGTVVVKLKGEEIRKLVKEVTARAEAEEVEEVRVSKHAHAFLVDANGVLLAHPRKEYLYRSLGPLSQAQIRKIDPQTTYELPTIQSLGIADLMEPLTDSTAAGSFVCRVPASYDPSGYTTWAGGYARMQERLWKVAVVEPHAELSQAIASILQRHGLMGLGVACVAAVVAMWRARKIVRPILSVTRAAKQLSSGDFSARAEQYGDDELGHMAAAFNAMVPQLKERVDLQQSMAVAMEVQQGLLPASDPDDPRFDIAGRARYCDATGGDYYDFIRVAHAADRSLIAVGDVSGHGIAAALVMALVRGAIRASAAEEDRLSLLLTKVNRVVWADSRHAHFMTLLLLTIDPESGIVRWASAGHDPPLVYRATTDTFDVPEGGQVPLGILPDTQYEEYQSPRLQTGDILFIGTDGIWETRSPARELFGKERLRTAIRDHRAETAAAIARAVENMLAEFRGSADQQDDVAFVVVKPKPSPRDRLA